MMLMNNKNKKKVAKLPQLKKDIHDFLLNEEGKIAKKDIAKLGISLAILAMMFAPEVIAQHSNSHSAHTSHTNEFFSGGEGGHDSQIPHGNAHSNAHSSHSAHSSGGWC